MKIMKIKLVESNFAALDAIVDVSNAGAKSHTTHASGLIQFAAAMESKLAALDIPKRARPGAIGHGMSGGGVPSAYKYSRIVSAFKIVRGASDWFLTDLRRVDCYGNAADDKLNLTQGQAAIAIANFSKQFSIQPAPVE